MKFLIATSSYPVAKSPHAGIFVQRNVAALEGLGVRCTVIRPGPSPARTDAKEPAHNVVEARVRKNNSGGFLGRGIPEEMKSHPFRTGWDLLRCTWSMTQQVRHHCSDVDWVLAHWAFPAGMAANRALMSQGRKPRLALWCHSSDVYALERIPLGAHIARRSLKRAEQIFVPSRDLAERLRRLLGPSKKIEVLHPGIDLGPPPESMPKGPLKVLFVGRLEDIKGLDVVVKLASLNPQWTFTVVGRGDQEARLRAAAARYTNLKVLGALPPEAIRSQLDSHHVLLAPGPQGKTRRTEGLPTVILEALAAGRAVVAGDTGGCSEVVNDEVGFLVPSGDFRACAAALQILSDSPSNLRSKSMAARDRARDFDSREIAKKIKALLF